MVKSDDDEVEVWICYNSGGNVSRGRMRWWWRRFSGQRQEWAADQRSWCCRGGGSEIVVWRHEIVEGMTKVL